MELGLKDKIVLVTGGSKGIGKTIAEAYAKEGCIVVINDILEEDLKQAVQEFKDNGYRACGYCFDITNQEAVLANIDKIEEEVGPISVLVNNAGLQRRYPLEEFPLAEWKRVLDVDLTGAFIVGQAAANKMIPRKCGRIVNITSINAELVREKISAYCAAKGGLKNLTKSMATEWGQYGIGVNAIGPGYVITDITRVLAEDPQFDAWVKSEVPLRRWGQKEDIANVAVFLGSQAAAYVSGQTIYVEGGWQACL